MSTYMYTNKYLYIYITYNINSIKSKKKKEEEKSLQNSFLLRFFHAISMPSSYLRFFMNTFIVHSSSWST